MCCGFLHVFHHSTPSATCPPQVTYSDVLPFSLNYIHTHRASLFYYAKISLAPPHHPLNGGLVLRICPVGFMGTAANHVQAKLARDLLSLRNYRTIRRRIWRRLFRQSSLADFSIYRQ